MGDAIFVREYNPMKTMGVILVDHEGKRVPIERSRDRKLQIDGTIFEGSKSYSYHPNGRVTVDPNDYSPWDLVEEISYDEAYSDDPYGHIAYEPWWQDQINRGVTLPGPHHWGLPHSMRELTLMVAGLKPFAIIGTKTSRLEFCKKHGLTYQQREMHGHQNAYVYLPHESWRIPLYENVSSMKVSDEDKYRIMGGLFGYRTQDVERWIARPKLIREYYEKKGKEHAQ
jgi:hypothetical protein